jgi:thiaminase/transcriptional activator TenA
MRFPRLLDLAHEAFATLTFNKAQPASDSISSKLWQQCQDIAKQCLQTKFVAGIGTGTLAPEEYGQYVVQDCTYCVNAQDDYQTVQKRANSANHPKLAAFAQARYEGYGKYTKQELKAWHIGNSDALALGQAAQQYVDFEHHVAVNLTPIYGVIAMIPCSQLWPWIASQLKPKSPSHNLYGFWISENDSWHPANRLNNFIDGWFAEHPDEFESKLALGVYRGSMTCELNMFRSGCGESLTPMPAWPVSQ